jgi:hypothetical protein
MVTHTCLERQFDLIFTDFYENLTLLFLGSLFSPAFYLELLMSLIYPFTILEGEMRARKEEEIRRWD